MKKVREEAVKMFMVLMFTLLPLYYSDNYYNILNDKRDIYWLFSRILFVVIAVSLCISLMLVIKNHQFSKNMRTQLRKISALDVVMLLFGILAIVSTVYSADIGNSIYGENAWDVGTQMIVCSVIVYFIISRCYSGKGDLWVYLYFGTAAVLAIGIIDRLGYDFLIMHDEIPLQYNIFISTIGNVNFWAGYLSMLIPFFMLAVLFTKNRFARFFIYLFLLAAYFSLFITLTNTTYIGVGIATLFIVWYSLCNVKRLKNLAVNGILFAIAGGIAEFLWRNPCTPRAIDTDSVSHLLLVHHLYLFPGLLGIVILVLLLSGAVCTEKIRAKADYFVEHMLSKFWIWLIMVGIIGTVFYIIYNYNLELFNFRGSIWYFSFMGFCDGTLWQKLLGVGPALLDTVTQAQIAKADFYVEWNWLYCTAHNDLLEYLVTMGVFGAACRLLMYVLPFVMYTKGKERKPEKAAVLAALVGYLGQGLFTGPYILTYVLYTIFLGVLGAYYRMGKEKGAEA